VGAYPWGNTYVDGHREILMMPVPAISHENWEKTKAVAQFAMGSEKVTPEELSFLKQVETIVTLPSDVDDTEEVEEIETYQGLTDYLRESTSEYVITNTGGHGHRHGDLDTPYYYPVHYDRNRPHRPQLSERVADGLETQVRKEWPTTPVETLSTDRQLDLLLDRAVPFFKEIGCYIAPQENKADN
jgi:hypothetical protein